ncbi:hypothetical protein ACFX11_032400 [Malus domestica]
MAARRGRWWRVVTNEWAGVEVLPWLQQKELRDLNERLNRDVGRVNVGEVRGRDGVANSPWVFDDEPHIFHEDTAVDEDVKVALHDDILLCFHTHVIQEKESTDIMESDEKNWGCGGIEDRSWGGVDACHRSKGRKVGVPALHIAGCPKIRPLSESFHLSFNLSWLASTIRAGSLSPNYSPTAFLLGKTTAATMTMTSLGFLGPSPKCTDWRRFFWFMHWDFKERGMGKKLQREEGMWGKVGETGGEGRLGGR